MSMPRYDPDTTTGAGGTSGAGAGTPVMLPILWSASLHRWPESLQVWPVAGGQLLMSLAELTRPDSEPVRHILLDGHSDGELSRLRTAAMVAMAAGLRIEEAHLAADTDLLCVTRADGLPVAGVVMLTGFRNRIAALRPWQELTVLIATPEIVYVAEAGSTGAQILLDRVLAEQEPVSGGLRPALLRVGAAGVQLEREAGAGAGQPDGPATDGPDQPGVAPQQGKVLLPVVRSASIKQGRDLFDMPWWAVAGDRVYATLAWMSWTPRQTIHQAHVLRAQVTDDDHLALLKNEALDGVRTGTRVEGIGDGGSVRLLRMAREDKLPVAGILLQPDFFESVSSLESWPELIVGMPHSEELYIAPAGSTEAETLQREVPAAEQCDMNLLPTVLRVTVDGVQFLRERDR